MEAAIKATRLTMKIRTVEVSLLFREKFVVRRDHLALQWLMTFKNPKAQAARWLEYLQTYDFNVCHRRGKSHINAESLSRRPCEEACKHYNKEKNMMSK
ncbi:hypothetical protein Zmor_026945 [Zophobas morio]|uniref:Reverse transcriptase RNase H-like domain-containing protein n=1 Tax=Zophobas morio TaxID=2755281 RepID=A0AA38I0E5_9CUCU|nr:hypothetical protein Zmor_026945 [Zophobas morio]